MARYDKTRKAETRDRIVAAASRRFRRDGIDAVGVATLMADVGLTHGGFYAHFPSKEALIKDSAVEAFAADIETLTAKYGSADQGLRGFIAMYLSRPHRDRPETGCPIAALAAELSRRPRETRAIVGTKIQGLIDYIAGLLPPAAGTAAERSMLATSILSLLAGCLQIARITPSRARSDAILRDGVTAALRLVGLPVMTEPPTPSLRPARRPKATSP